MCLRLRVEPVRQPAGGASRLCRIHRAEANGVAGAGLGEQRKIGADDGRDHRIAARRLVIDMQDDQSA